MKMTLSRQFVTAAALLALTLSAAAQSVRQPKPTAGVARHSAAPETKSDEQTPSPQLVTRADSRALLPPGTAIRVKLTSVVSTRDLNPGDPFTATVTEAVAISGRTVVPKGATMSGKVARIGEPRRIAGRPWVELRPDTVTTVDGREISITAVVVDTSLPHTYTVNDEGRIAGPTYKKSTAIGTGALAGSGALTGALVAGPVGSLIGAGTGAGIGTGHYFVSRHSMTLPADLEIIFEISNQARS
jgi:hypothetical protein